MLSTVILNWNRARLLRKTVESYFATTQNADVELFIVDNASGDGSRDYLRGLEAERPVRIIYLEQNAGGEAYNRAIPLAQGDLIHLSENDQMFFPGWVEHVGQSFITFGDLGQLSLFSDVPTDTEAWENRPARLRFKAGKILYEAEGNVGTSSIIRGILFRERGLKICNIESGTFKFPNDEQLSGDIKAAGYWVAWSDRYYVRNVGHELAEFEADPSYYEQNYLSKPWLGIDGWRARIEQQKRMPIVQRKSIVLGDLPAIPEKTPNPVKGRPARLWSMFDGYTAETEVLDFLHALVRLIKPERVLETGTWLGLAACAIGTAMAANGFGRLTTLEINPEAHECALKNLRRYDVERFVDALLFSSMEYTPTAKFDMALFDSDLMLRAEEFQRFRPWLNDEAIVVFHDTAPHHVVVKDAVENLAAAGVIVGLNLPTPRGIFIGKLASATDIHQKQTGPGT